MAGYPPAPPPPGQPGPPQGPYGPQNPYGPQQGYGGYPPQNPYGAQQPYGPPGGPPGPPGGPMPPYPNQPAPRRTGVIVGVIAGGLALLLGVGGVVTWVLMQPPAAYTELPACDDVVTDAVTDITGQRNPETEEYAYDSSEFPDNADRELEELADCGVFEDVSLGYASEEFLAVGLGRYASDTAEDDYERVRRAAEKSEPGDTLEEVTEPEEVSVGDTGIQYIAGYNSEALYGEDPGGSMSIVKAADRNMVVTIWYRAPDRVSDDEKRDISLQVANEIVRILPEVVDVAE